MRVVSNVVSTLLENTKARSAFFLMTDNGRLKVVRATRRHKSRGRARTDEFVVTIGAPNFRERKLHRRHGLDVLGEVLIREYPKARR